MTETEYYREVLEEIRDFKPHVKFDGEFWLVLDMQGLQASARVALRHGPMLAACNRAVHKARVAEPEAKAEETES